MTKGELQALKTISTRIQSLASLENAGFSMDKEKDASIKSAIKPYMQWFDSVACMLDNLVEADEKGDRRAKQEAIEYIYRYCN